MNMNKTYGAQQYIIQALAFDVAFKRWMTLNYGTTANILSSLMTLSSLHSPLRTLIKLRIYRCHDVATVVWKRWRDVITNPQRHLE